MKTSISDFRNSAMSISQRLAMAAAIALPLTGSTTAQLVLPGTRPSWVTGSSNSWVNFDVPGHPCHNKYHDIRVGPGGFHGGLYGQQNEIAAELDTTGSMPENVTPSPAQCTYLRELVESHKALERTYLAEISCDKSTHEPIIPELETALADRYRRQGNTERFLKLCPGGVPGEAQRTRPKVGQAKRRQPAPE